MKKILKGTENKRDMFHIEEKDKDDIRFPLETWKWEDRGPTFLKHWKKKNYQPKIPYSEKITFKN